MPSGGSRKATGPMRQHMAVRHTPMLVGTGAGSDLPMPAVPSSTSTAALNAGRDHVSHRALGSGAQEIGTEYTPPGMNVTNAAARRLLHGPPHFYISFISRLSYDRYCGNLYQVDAWGYGTQPEHRSRSSRVRSRFTGMPLTASISEAYYEPKYSVRIWATALAALTAARRRWAQLDRSAKISPADRPPTTGRRSTAPA